MLHHQLKTINTDKHIHVDKMETALSKQTNQLIQKSHEIKHQQSQTRYGN